VIECVLFDFDETLTRRDTTRMWLDAFARRHPLKTLRNARRVLAVRRATRRPQELQNTKFQMIGSLLKGLAPDDLQTVHDSYADTVRQYQRDITWRAMEDHLAAGRHVLVVTASLRSAVEHIFRATTVETLGTEFELRDGIFTGVLHGNGCFGAAKTTIIAEWAAQQGQPVRFVEAWSDSLSDWPMMRLSERRHWICPPADAEQIRRDDPAGFVVCDDVTRPNKGSD
jgi:HAD superfamily hydrolase (TIGR01490 family)